MLYFKIYLFIFIFIKNYQNPKQKSKTKGVGMVCTVTPNGSCRQWKGQLSWPTTAKGWLVQLPPTKGLAQAATPCKGVSTPLLGVALRVTPCV
jgi:hypothetical protein